MAQLVNLSIQAMGRDESIRERLDAVSNCDLIAIDDAFDTEKVYVSDNGMQNARMDDIFRGIYC